MMSMLACDPDLLAVYFITPSSVDFNLISKAFCGFNATLLIDELTTEFNVGKLMDKVSLQVLKTYVKCVNNVI